MGKPDTITKEYMRRPDIFADVFNKFLYHGGWKILPEMLAELDTTEIAVPYGADDTVIPEQRYRDVAKMLTAMTDGRAAYCIFAVENEMKVNYAMPVKDGLYDFMQLAKQVSETARSHKKSGSGDKKPTGDEYLSGFWKSDKLLPVVTLTGARVKYSEKEDKVDMCIALQEIKEEGRLEGEIIGVIRTYKRMQIAYGDTERYIMEEYHKSEEEAGELMETYWK